MEGTLGWYLCGVWSILEEVTKKEANREQALTYEASDEGSASLGGVGW